MGVAKNTNSVITEWKLNKEILEKVKQKKKIVRCREKMLKMGYFRHIKRRRYSLEKGIMLRINTVQEKKGSLVLG